MNRVITVNTLKLHEAFEAVAKRAYEAGHKHGKARKDVDLDHVKIDIKNVLRLDEKLQAKRPPGGRK